MPEARSEAEDAAESMKPDAKNPQLRCPSGIVAYIDTGAIKGANDKRRGWSHWLEGWVTFVGWRMGTKSLLINGESRDLMKGKGT